ncbi:hypothetical protein hmeg3_06685 [Herbaspirillum sp. meg3]|uniref:hypothetical protein n=1 Tax=Herbaspirillum sp. meg3 TaxID=2025949 RepID=UPI000B99726F|nr:hypothetical protein [Herbaspirillum sp. meg3]ASU38014.1 hypothetical protein hmeg3_06685 [Herbaspirillum sp. meg3]
MNHCLVADLGGLPMIDEEVKTSALATLVCAVRQRLDNKKQPLTAYLQPELARDCYRHASTQPVTELDSIPLNKADIDTIQRTCKDVISIVPKWQSIFSVPLCWRRLVDDIFSSSNPLIPQHIYLGEGGISSPRLAEYIVHEVSHTWVGMIAEITPLAERSEPIHVLPSGTSGKEITQVIYALTFAVTAVRFYRAKIFAGCNTVDDGNRLTYLENYADGCLKIVEPSGKLTSNGIFIAESCRRFLSSLR